MDSIDGVTVTPLKVVSVPGGDVYHAIKATDETFRGFGEAYFSSIKPQMIKSWKRHNRMTLNLVVITGKVRFVVHDDRPNSPSYNRTKDYVLGPDGCYARLTVQPGLWMAFQGVADTTSLLLNVADIPHDPQEIDRLDLSDAKFKWSWQ